MNPKHTPYMATIGDTKSDPKAKAEEKATKDVAALSIKQREQLYGTLNLSTVAK
jgi:hypothetical protein